jgi:hypothetical protein
MNLSPCIGRIRQIGKGDKIEGKRLISVAIPDIEE